MGFQKLALNFFVLAILIFAPERKINLPYTASKAKTSAGIMSSPIVQAQQQGGLHLFSSVFLLSIEKACGNHYQGSWGQLGNEFTFLVQPNVLASSNLSYIPCRRPTFGKRFGKLAPKPVMDSSRGLRKDMALGRFAVVAGSWRTWKANTQWVVGI